MMNIMIEKRQITKELKAGYMIPVKRFLKGDFTPYNYKNIEEYNYIYDEQTKSIRDLFGNEVSRKELENALLSEKYEIWD